MTVEKSKHTPLDRRLIVILLIVFVNMLGATMVLPLLPLYATSRFDMSYETVTLINAAFFAAQFVAGPFLGRLSDKYGRVPVLIVSQIGTVISFLMIAMAQNVEMLFLARILDGITGGNIIVAQAYITDITPREQRTQALGYLFAAFGLGFVIGPATSGILAHSMSYETPYFVAAIATTLVVLMSWFILDESLSPEQRIINNQKTTRPMAVRTVLANTPLVSILIMGFVSQVGFAMLQSTFSLFGKTVLFAADPEQADLGVGLLYAVLGLGQLFTQLFLIRRLVARIGESSLVVTGVVARMLALLIVLLLPFTPTAAIALFFFAMGTGMQMPALQSLVTTTVPESQRGSVLGWYQSSTSLAIICGSAISGSLFAITPQLPFLLGAVLFGVVLVPSLYLMRWAQGQEVKRKNMLDTQPLAVGD